MRAWMTSTSSSRSSKMVSQYSSNAGWYSGVLYGVMRRAESYVRPRSIAAAHTVLGAWTAQPCDVPSVAVGCQCTVGCVDPRSTASRAPVRAWFATTFPEPTAAQAQGWPAIASGDHTLILAPTGSARR